MDTNISTNSITIESAKNTFEDCDYKRALGEFSVLSGDEAKIYILACEELSEEMPLPENLLKKWKTAYDIVDSKDDGHFCDYALVLYRAFSVLTATIYRNCNLYQQKEFFELKKDVSFEKKEYVLSKMQEVILKADESYDAIFEVIFAYTRLVVNRMDTAGIRSSELSKAVLSYAKSAAELAGEIGLPKNLDGIELARLCCRVDTGDDEELINCRSAVLKATLIGEEALSEWDYFEPFATVAGIEKKPLEKRAKVEARRRKVRAFFKMRK